MSSEDCIEGLSGNIFEDYLNPHFLEAYWPVREGNTLIVHGSMQAVEFKPSGPILANMVEWANTLPALLAVSRKLRPDLSLADFCAAFKLSPEHRESLLKMAIRERKLAGICRI
ncbi:hypothetical protein BDR05DRAFT_998074 [Suillus weaverae]|nr:hypothetical protein BDR05DRAFT_998074 [Suillus weaverae]